MNFTEKQQKIQEITNDLFSKCWEDAAFKNELVANPQTALEQFIGQPLSLKNDQKLVIEDQTNENHIYLNIPAEPNLDELELTEEQLELVAGGVVPVIFWVLTATGAGVAVGRAIGDIINKF
ncbi:class IIb bacteriocin, lactobin A/cerein 7B family [Aquimarina sp. 2201CG1-2-11]|uniref:class IIb bacteriocin, lactobin A/cerein 7B family n=1 Tax=Aquimarina discodermiae TaxID=3231043 RepID=UPI0034619F66